MDFIDRTPAVGTAINLINETTIDRGGSEAVDICTRIITRSVGIIVIGWYYGTVTITTTENTTDTTTVDKDVGVGCYWSAASDTNVSCVAATKNVFNGVVTSINVYRGALVGHRNIGCSVATAKDGAKGEIIVSTAQQLQTGHCGRCRIGIFIVA